MWLRNIFLFFRCPECGCRTTRNMTGSFNFPSILESLESDVLYCNRCLATTQLILEAIDVERMVPLTQLTNKSRKVVMRLLCKQDGCGIDWETSLVMDIDVIPKNIEHSVLKTLVECPKCNGHNFVKQHVRVTVAD